MTARYRYENELRDLISALRTRDEIEGNSSEFNSDELLEIANIQLDRATKVFISRAKSKLEHITSMAFNIVNKMNSRLPKDEQINMAKFRWFNNPERLDWDTAVFEGIVNDLVVFVHRGQWSRIRVEIPRAWLSADDKIIASDIREAFDSRFNKMLCNKAASEGVMLSATNSSGNRINYKLRLNSGLEKRNRIQGEIHRMEAQIVKLQTAIERQREMLQSVDQRTAQSVAAKSAHLATLAINVLSEENRRVEHNFGVPLQLEGFEWATNAHVDDLVWDNAEINFLNDEKVSFILRAMTKFAFFLTLPIVWLDMTDEEIVESLRGQFNERYREVMKERNADQIAKLEQEAIDLEAQAEQARRKIETLISN